MHDLVARYGGSFSAEHGIGRLKRDELLRYKHPVAIELMRSIKQALDPNGIMNPGKVPARLGIPTASAAVLRVIAMTLERGCVPGPSGQWLRRRRRRCRPRPDAGC